MTQLLLTSLARQFLNERFSERWIGRGGPINQPPRFADFGVVTIYGVCVKMMYMQSKCRQSLCTNSVNYNTPGVFNNVVPSKTQLKMFKSQDGIFIIKIRIQ